MGVFFSALDKREDDDVTINDVDIMFVDLFGVVCAEVDGESDEFLTGGLFSFLILFISACEKENILFFLQNHIIPYYLPSRETTVPAILAGRGLRAAGIERLLINPDVDIVVDVDMALPGLEELAWPPGVTLPEREPTLR